MKQLLINLINTLMACIVILFSVLCVLAMAPLAFALSFINSLHQGNNE